MAIRYGETKDARYILKPFHLMQTEKPIAGGELKNCLLHWWRECETLQEIPSASADNLLCCIGKISILEEASTYREPIVSPPSQSFLEIRTVTVTRCEVPCLLLVSAHVHFAFPTRVH